MLKDWLLETVRYSLWNHYSTVINTKLFMGYNSNSIQLSLDINVDRYDSTRNVGVIKHLFDQTSNQFVIVNVHNGTSLVLTFSIRWVSNRLLVVKPKRSGFIVPGGIRTRDLCVHKPTFEPLDFGGRRSPILITTITLCLRGNRL